MRPVHRRSHVNRGSSWRQARRLGTVLVLAGLSLVFVSRASASTLNGVATIATPASLTALGSGGSTTVFTVTLPANAACTGDTASKGYHVYSYLVPKGTSPSSVTFVNSPSTGYGFVDNTGLYYGPANTAIGTGQIVSIPQNFQWAPLVTDDGVTLAQLLSGPSAGVWEAGIACADTTGHLSDNWNTEITFSASSGDPNGFVWTVSSGTTGTTTTTAGGTTTTGGGGTTTTSVSDTSTTAVGSTTTSAGSAGTTPDSATTTAPASPGVVAASGSGDGSSGTGASGTGSSDPGTSGGNLAFTGLPVTQSAGIGLLGVGVGLMLLGWRRESRRRTRTMPRSSW